MTSDLKRESYRVLSSEWVDAAAADDNISPQPHEYKALSGLKIRLLVNKLVYSFSKHVHNLLVPTKHAYSLQLDT